MLSYRLDLQLFAVRKTTFANVAKPSVKFFLTSGSPSEIYAQCSERQKFILQYIVVKSNYNLSSSNYTVARSIHNISSSNYRVQTITI